MVTKQSVLETIQTLPDTASWSEITDALLRLAASVGTPSEFARFYRQQLTAENILEYLEPEKFDVDFSQAVKELEDWHNAQNRS